MNLTRFCEASGKIRHETREAAHDHLKNFRGQKVKRKGFPMRHSGDLHAYRCPDCGGWHIGHRLGCSRNRRR